MGWCAQADGDEWVRKGDYVTSTHHDLKMKLGENEYDRDILVECYGEHFSY